MKIVLLSGKMRCGKNVAADFIADHLKSRGFTVDFDYYARDLKQHCQEDFKDLIDYLNDWVLNFRTLFKGLMSKSMVHEIDHLLTGSDNWYEEKKPINRILLQTYGTQIFRNRVDKDYWVKNLVNRIIKSKADYTLITDARFKNEIEKLIYYYTLWKDSNILKSLITTHTIVKIRIKKDDAMGINSNHESETDLDNYTGWDFEINNNGSLEILKDRCISIAEVI